MTKAPNAAGTPPVVTKPNAAGTPPGPAEGAEPEEVAMPAKIRITHLHGFIDDNKRQREWKGGEVITDPDEIALLVERKARFEVLED